MTMSPVPVASARTASAKRHRTLCSIALLLAAALGVILAIGVLRPVTKSGTPLKESLSSTSSHPGEVSRIAQRSNTSPQPTPRASGGIKETVTLCEVENPRFDAQEECQKVIYRKYSGQVCTFKLGPVKFGPTGSCRDCLIQCN